MKFSKQKFNKLPRKQKIKILLKFINEIETSWNNKSKRSDLINEFKRCLVFINEIFFYEIFENVDDNSRREFIKSVIKIEKKYGSEKRDYDLNIITNDGLREPKKLPIYLILDELRSAFNIGSIFRSAECFGIQEVLVTGYTASPENTKVRKTSMGTASLVDWKKFETIGMAVKYMQDKGVKVYALETVSEAKSFESVKLDFPCCFILGNEALGISKETLTLADEILQIPLSGWKNSLNVGVTAAICCYEAGKQYSLQGQS